MMIYNNDVYLLLCTVKLIKNLLLRWREFEPVLCGEGCVCAMMNCGLFSAHRV